MKLPVCFLSAIAISCSCATGYCLEAIATPKQLNLTISTKQNQSFSSLIKEAEARAQDAVQQSFQTSKGITNVAVYVSGERNGQKVPLITAVVSQSSWQKNPQVKSWAKYFQDAELLLGFITDTRIAQIRQSTATNPLVNPLVSSLVEPAGLYPSENEPNFYK